LADSPNTITVDLSAHSAFVLQEAVQSLGDSGNKAYVAFLDIRKAFYTVW